MANTSNYLGVEAPPLQLTDEQQVVFLHIPKTAGTTFITLLYRIFPISAFCPWHFMDNIPDKIEGYKVYVGHFYYDVVRRFVRSNAVYLTFLRNPIERTISNYYEIKKDSEKHPENYPNFPETLEKFIFDPKYEAGLFNLQTRLLCQEIKFSNLSEMVEVWRTANIYELKLTDEMVHHALDKLHFIGITERFNDSLALLFYTLGLEPIFDQEALNVGSYQSKAKDLPPHVLERIIEMNRDDIKLYEYGQRLFQERFDQMVKKLSIQNYALIQAAKALPHDQLPQAIHFRTQASEPLLASEFSAKISVDQTTLKLKTGEHAEVKVMVQNISPVLWKSLSEVDGRYAIRLGCYWKTGATYLNDNQTRAGLPYDLYPGEGETLTITFVAPSEPGDYTAYLSMIQEGVSWFKDGEIGLSVEVY